MLPRATTPGTTMKAAREAVPRRPSESIAPAPTGLASVSTSSCFDVAEVLTRLCQPDMAPQDMATKSMGHIGPAVV